MSTIANKKLLSDRFLRMHELVDFIKDVVSRFDDPGADKLWQQADLDICRSIHRIRTRLAIPHTPSSLNRGCDV